ncbi:YkyB family protein [Gottfriedia luciferensis]|uniref:YkyB family protein n=1 Tax=Gottfriedia luciferensis TaxID=178774 RepID=UPI000B43B4E3|nr:YkyB family protein [Gottfriedia luciferensis]
MKSKEPGLNKLNFTNEEIFQAIFVVNKHAKTALEPSELYSLKRQAILKLIDKGIAKKVGLHFSNNPRSSKQQSDVLIACGEFFFHIPPLKEDFKLLPHLGILENTHRNPKVSMSLSYAKKILHHFLGKAKVNTESNLKTGTTHRRNTPGQFSRPTSYLSNSTFTFPSEPIRKNKGKHNK